MKGFGKVLVALGVLAAAAAAVLKIIDRNRLNYTEVEFEDITDEEEPAAEEAPEAEEE